MIRKWGVCMSSVHTSLWNVHRESDCDYWGSWMLIKMALYIPKKPHTETPPVPKQAHITTGLPFQRSDLKMGRRRLCPPPPPSFTWRSVNTIRLWNRRRLHQCNTYIVNTHTIFLIYLGTSPPPLLPLRLFLWVALNLSLGLPKGWTDKYSYIHTKKVICWWTIFNHQRRENRPPKH